MALLEIDDLRIGFPAGGRMIEVVRGVSFTVEAGEAVGLVGESGSGKSQTALAIMRLLRPPGRIVGGSVRLDGQDLTRADEPAMRRLRGGTISMVFQDAMSGLNPVFPVGAQLTDVVRAHRRVSARVARDVAVETLELVGIRDAAGRLGQYPHQFSGGMRQRVLIAMAVACRPRLLIADEPTTALDVTVQAQIVTLLRDLRLRLGIGLLFITHNLDLMSEICDRAIVLYGGMVMEDGPVATLFDAPKQPYTRALVECVPRLSDRAGDLRPIEGSSPVPAELHAGCPFQPRCVMRLDRCATECPGLVPWETPLPGVAQPDGHRVACWNPGP